jgi:hypothetical protein
MGETVPYGVGRRVCSAARIDLRVDVSDVSLYGPDAQDKLLADRAVAEAPSD